MTMMIYVLLCALCVVAQNTFDPMNSIRVSEMMSHTDPPAFEYVEIRNTAAVSVNLTGWSYSQSLNLAVS